MICRNLFIFQFILMLLNISISIADNISGIGTDFSSIFNNASTEQNRRDIIPTYQGTNIPEAQITPNSMNNQASIGMKNNETGIFINNSFTTRPKYDTNQLGNVVKNSERLKGNSRTLTDKNYSDPRDYIEYRICYKYYGKNNCTNNNYNKHCTNDLKLKCTAYESGCRTSGLELDSFPSDLDWSYYENNNILIIGKKNGANYWNGTCLVIDKTIEFTVSNLSMVEIFSLTRAVFDDYISITLNDRLIYVGPDNGNQLIVISGMVYDGRGFKPCERNTVWNQYLGRDLIPLLRVGKNILKMRVIVGGSGQGSMEFILKNKCCREHVEEWIETCDNSKIEDKCYLIEKICTKKDQIIRLDGKDFLKKCLAYRQVYSCKAHNSCFNYDYDCDKINTNGCELETREYVNSSKKLEKFTYRCLNPRPIPNIDSEKIQCIDGECNSLEPTPDNTQDMTDALVLLSTLNESAKTIKSDDKTMLNGENLKCKKSTGAAISFSNCCGSGNWGNSLGFSCNSDEKKLRKKRNRSDCIYIGSYCSNKIDMKIVKICMARKQSYCCYDNKFSKIIGNATRQQGLQTWGNAENTNCGGIPIDKLQNLDFSRIDFSELYNDIRTGVDQVEISNRIQQTLNKLKNANK